MLYQKFVEKIIEQDKRNLFSKYEGDLGNYAKEIKEFYFNYNPVDVEFDYKGFSVRLVSASDFDKIKSEYSYLSTDLIIATCNGDPIFLKNGNVYTCPHGVKTPNFEKLADSFDEYLTSIIQ